MSITPEYITLRNFTYKVECQSGNWKLSKADQSIIFPARGDLSIKDDKLYMGDELVLEILSGNVTIEEGSMRMSMTNLAPTLSIRIRDATVYNTF